MHTLRVVAVVLVVLVAGLACAPGPAGPAGPPGPAGATGPQGDRGPQGQSFVAGSALVWKDAAGVATGLGDRLMVEDGNGYWWFLNAETAGPDGAQHSYGPAAGTLYFTGSNCTGSTFLAGPLPPPRVPFAYGGRSPYRVRSDTALFQTVVIYSKKDVATNCANITTPGGQALYLFADSDAPQINTLAPPGLGLTPPLHLEHTP